MVKAFGVAEFNTVGKREGAGNATKTCLPQISTKSDVYFFLFCSQAFPLINIFMENNFNLVVEIDLQIGKKSRLKAL